MKLLQEFRECAVKGNVVDLAVGIVIGAAFGKIVTAFVDGIVMPLLGMITGGVDFSDRAVVLSPATVDATGAEVPAVLLQYGLLIQTMLDFAIVAFAIFLVVKAINRMKRREEAKPDPVPSEEVKLLTEIRDALKR